MPSILPYRVEYSIVERNNCNKCRKLIPPDALQIGIMQQSMTEDCMKPEWYDMVCFFKIRRPASEDLIDGFANLRYSHQMQIRGNLDVDINGNAINVELEKQIEKQNDEFYTIYDKLKGFMERDDFVAILNENNQFVPKYSAEAVNHLSDVICFGALAPCFVCKEGKFVFRNSVYRCTGYDSPWTSCTNTVKEPERVSIKIPEKYQGILGTDFKVHTRILRDATKFNEDDFEMHTKQPLFNLEFVIGLTRMSREDIKNKIHAMGGKIASKINKNIAAVISNANEVNNCSALIREAFVHRIQVIPDDFFNEVMDNDPIELIVKKDYCKWGIDPYERIPKLKFAKQRYIVGQNYFKYNPNTDDRRGHTVYCSDNLKYEAVLDFVDIISNKNSYFKLQLLEFSYGDPKYVINESMGRIGTSIGTSNRKNYATLNEAQSEFKKIYQEKTGNEFGTNSFVKKPGLYNHVNIDYCTLPNVNRNVVPTKLAKPLYELMELLYSDETVFESAINAFCFDMDGMPLGKLKKIQIQDAMNLLAEISLMQNSGNINKIIAASNQFYSCFPHDVGLRQLPVIKTSKMVQEKMDMLQNLLKKDLNYEYLISESNQSKNLLDLCYEQLQNSAEITMLNKSSRMYTIICDYIKNTQLHNNNHLLNYYCEVEEIFEVLRYEELIRYKPYENHIHRKLLFHGTTIQNLVGILTKGLMIAPPEAKFLLHLDFGFGIYFSDSLSESAAYCRSNNEIGLVLLCEVAVGMIDTRYKHDASLLKEHCESVQAIGQYYPHPVHMEPDGLIIPNGKLTKRTEETGMLFNEFVVPDVSRVKIRYLVKLKFKMPGHA